MYTNIFFSDGIIIWYLKFRCRFLYLGYSLYYFAGTAKKTREKGKKIPKYDGIKNIQYRTECKNIWLKRQVERRDLTKKKTSSKKKFKNWIKLEVITNKILWINTVLLQPHMHLKSNQSIPALFCCMHACCYSWLNVWLCVFFCLLSWALGFAANVIKSSKVETAQQAHKLYTIKSYKKKFEITTDGFAVFFFFFLTADKIIGWAFLRLSFLNSRFSV